MHLVAQVFARCPTCENTKLEELVFHFSIKLILVIKTSKTTCLCTSIHGRTVRDEHINSCNMTALGSKMNCLPAQLIQDKCFKKRTHICCRIGVCLICQKPTNDVLISNVRCIYQTCHVIMLQRQYNLFFYFNIVNDVTCSNINIFKIL